MASAIRRLPTVWARSGSCVVVISMTVPEQQGRLQSWQHDPQQSSSAGVGSPPQTGSPQPLSGAGSHSPTGLNGITTTAGFRARDSDARPKTNDRRNDIFLESLMYSVREGVRFVDGLILLENGGLVKFWLVCVRLFVQCGGVPFVF